jgi:nicotinate-nucleotide adenylyltransferase
MRIGILGGTFNPPHLGHLKMAECAKHEFDLDEVWFVPAGIPPHKEVLGNAVSDDRLNMVKLLIEGKSGLILKDFESHKAFRNYTYLTFQYLKSEYPDDELFYIIGEDSLRNFDTWVHPESISKNASILVAIRDSSDFEELKALCEEANDKYEGNFFPMSMSEIDVSSTNLREKLYMRAKDSKIEEISDSVLAYINDRDLYLEKKAYTSMEIKDIMKDLKKELKPSRYEHTMGVMYTAETLAMRYNYPLEKAKLAGLLHDCAKNLSDEKLLKICAKNGIEVTKAEEAAPYLLHAKVGAYFAQTKYEVTDEEILHAISVHTTGCPNMSLLDKIIFTADYIEPNRKKAANLPEIRSKAFIDIDEAIVFILRDTLNYLEESNSNIDDMTKQTFEYYKEHTDYFKF